MSVAPRILLIAGTCPGEPGVGGVILRDLVSIVGAQNLHCCWLNPLRNDNPQFLPELSVSFHQRRYETGWRPVRGILGDLAAFAASMSLRKSLIQKAVSEIKDRIRQFQPDMILSVMDCSTSVDVVHALTSEVTIPVRTIVWDDIETVSPPGTPDRRTGIQIRKRFADVLRRSQRVAVICENMQKAYQQKYGVQSLIIRHGMPEIFERERSETRTDETLRIGFAGSITTPDCIQSLIATLDGMGWRRNERNICLRMLGARFQLGTKSPQWIEYLGWRDVSETRDLLGQCDLLYLPQSFLPSLRNLSELSFPTKLSTYVAARCPILLHAPHYASLSDLWSRHALGPICDSLDTAALTAALDQGFNRTDPRRDEWLNAGDQVRTEVLNVRLFEQGVRVLLAAS